MEQMKANEESLLKAADTLLSHGTVVYPTDTLYGIGASAASQQGVNRIYDIKKMKPSPHSIIMADAEMMEEYVAIDPAVEGFLRVFPAGPFTVIADIKEERRGHITGHLIQGDKVGIRIPLHPFTRKLAKLAGPYTSTSANVHGQLPPKTFNEIKLQGADLYIDDGPCLYGKSSTIIQEIQGKIKIIRTGALSSSVLKQYLK